MRSMFQQPLLAATPAALLAAAISWATTAPATEPATEPAKRTTTDESVRLQIDKPAEVTFHAAWEPGRESKYGLFQENELLSSVSPAKPEAAREIALANAFLPADPVSVGDVWPVDRRAILPLLRQFDPSASTTLDPYPFESAGTYGCLVGLDDRRAYVVTRSHARFRLDEDVLYRPAQFEGHWWIDHVDGRLLSARIELPNRNPNVDVNCPKEFTLPGEDKPRIVNAADIGWVPTMKLTSGQALSDAIWAESIDLEEARLKLRREFYTFAQLDWLPFEEAVRESRARNQPLHVVVLFGTLDDAAC